MGKSGSKNVEPKRTQKKQRSCVKNPPGMKGKSSKNWSKPSEGGHDNSNVNNTRKGHVSSENSLKRKQIEPRAECFHDVMEGISNSQQERGSSAKKKGKIDHGVTMPSFEEEGDTIKLEVKRQATEFASEMEDGDRSESDDEDMCQEEMDQTFNNNAMLDSPDFEEGTLVHNPQQEEEDDDDEVTIQRRNKEDTEKQEEAEMQKFVDFMKDKGW